MKRKIQEFLDINSSWFTDKSNSLFGLRAASQDTLIKFVNTGKYPRLGYKMPFVIDKFQE